MTYPNPPTKNYNKRQSTPRIPIAGRPAPIIPDHSTATARTKITEQTENQAGKPENSPLEHQRDRPTGPRQATPATPPSTTVDQVHDQKAQARRLYSVPGHARGKGGADRLIRSATDASAKPPVLSTKC
jgi:hypothetical protein